MIFWTWFIFAVFTGIVVGYKGYNVLVTLVLSIFGPIGLIVSLVLPNNNKNREIKR